MIASFISRTLRKSLWLFVSLFFIGVFSSLGIWQTHRAEAKEALLQQYQARTQHAPLNAVNLSEYKDARFYPILLKGHYDYAHTFYLDNKTHKGKAGYEVYTPFIVEGLSQAILVDRGWLPLGKSRAELPPMSNEQDGTIIVKGILNVPPSFFALGPLYDKDHFTWPLRIEFIDLQILSKLLGYPVFSYVVWLDSVSTPSWQVVTTPPEKHRGYALQWFAFALTVLVLYVFLNKKRV